MIIFFPSQVRQICNQEKLITVSAKEQTLISVVSGVCSLRLGEDKTEKQQVLAEAGEKVSLVFTTKSGYAEKDTFEFLVNGERSFFVYCTEDDPAKIFDNYYHGKSFLDVVTSVDGASIDYKNDNTLEFFGVDGVQTSVALDVFAAPDFVLSDNQTYMLDNRSGAIYKIDVDNKIAIKKLSLGSPAVGMAVTKTPTSSEKVTWMTLKDGRVICLDKEENIIQQLAINGVATGIDTSVDGRLVVICDTAANQVFIYEHQGGNDWKSAILPSSGYPYDVFVDSQKNIWVTSKLGSTLTVFPFGSRIPIQLEVGKGQKTVKQVNERTIGVVCTESNEIVMLDARTKAVKERVSVEYPVDIAVIDKTVYIANAKSEILKMQLVGSAVSAPIEPYLEAMPTIYALDVDKESASLIVAKMYGNTPNMLSTPDRLIDFVAFEGQPQVFTHYTSDSVIASGIGAPVEAYLPTGLNKNSVAKFKVLTDGLDSGTTVVSGSKLKFEFEPYGEDKEKITFPLLIGNFLTYFESTLKITTSDIKPFRFHNLMLTTLDDKYVSNDIIILGLAEDQTSEFFIHSGSSEVQLFLNGQLAQLPYFVKNDDVIRVEAQFQSTDFETNKSVFLRATCEDHTARWQILLVDLMAGEVVTKPYTKGLPLQSLNWNLGSWGEITVLDQQLNTINHIGLWPEDITNLPVSDVENEILVCDYSNKKVFVIDSLTDTSSWASPLLESGPYQAVRIGSEIFVSIPDSNKIVVLNSDLTFSKEVPLFYSPYGLVAQSGKLVVAGSNGKVYFYKPDSMNLDDQQEPIMVSGFLLDIVLDGSDLLVSDFTNNKIKVIKNGLVHKSYQVGTNPTSISVDTGRRLALVTNNYDNTVTEINLANDSTTTTALGRPIHQSILFDQKWQIIDMQTSNIVEGFVAGTEFGQTTIKQNSGLAKNKNKLYVLHLASEYINILEERIYASSDDFIPQLAVDINNPVTSNFVTLNYMSRPQKLSLMPDLGYRLIHNQVLVGDAAMVNSGDSIAIVATTPRHFEAVQEIILSGTGYAKPFLFKTLPNYVPDFIKFETIFGAIPGEQVVSNEVVISGLSEDCIADISCSDKFVLVYKNGILTKDLGSVGLIKIKNGDKIQLRWEVELNTNSLATLHNLTSVIPNVIFATWNVYQISLMLGAKLGVFVNWTKFRYQQSEACLVWAKQYKIDGKEPETFTFDTFDTLGAFAYTKTDDTHFSQLFAQEVYSSTIMTYTPYSGAILERGKSYFGQLNLGKIIKPLSFWGNLSGPLLTKPKSFWGNLDGPLLTKPKSFWGNLVVAEPDTAAKTFYNQYGFKFLVNDVDFLFDTFASSPKITSGFYGYNSFYTSSPLWHKKETSAASYAAKDNYFESEAYPNRNFFEPSEHFLFYTATFAGSSYPSAYDSHAPNNSNIDSTAVSFTNENTNIDAVAESYPATLGVANAQDFDIVINPDPVKLTPNFSWAPSSYYGHFSNYVNHQQSNYLWETFGISGSQNTYYSKNFPINHKLRPAINQYRPESKVGDWKDNVQVHNTKGFSKQSTKFNSVGTTPVFVMQVDLSSKIDQQNILEEKRGAYNIDGVTNFIDNDEYFDDTILKPYKLIDGSWMYYHPNRLKYGECILHDYIVTHGLVKGG